MNAPPELTPRQSELLNRRPSEHTGRIVLLDDSAQCYRVEAGEVSVYAARMRGDTPLYSRRKVGAFGPGEFIFSGPALPPDSLPMTPEELEYERAQQLHLGLFMTVNEQDSVSLVDKQALLQHADLAEHAVAGADNWVRKMAEALPKNTDLPEFPTLRFSADGERRRVIDKDSCVQRDDADHGILWLHFEREEGARERASESESESAALANYRGLAVARDGGLERLCFPLLGRDLAVVHANTGVSIATTRELFERDGGAAWVVDGFDYLAKVLLYLHALQTEQQQQRGIARARKIEAQNLSTMFDNFRNAFQGKEDAVPYTMVMDRTSANGNLLVELCTATNSEIRVVDPELVEAVNCDTLQGVERLLSLGGFDKRKVTLEGKWYKRDSWTMVGFLEGLSCPVVLHYQRSRYRYYNPETHQWSPLSDPEAQKISPEALVIYRPLSERVTGLRDFLVQALQLAHVDIKRILITAVMLGAITLVNPVIMGQLISKALPSFDYVLLNSYLLALFASVLGVFAATFFNSIAMLRIETYLSLDMHASIWGRLLRLPMTFFKQHNVGDLASRANIFDDLQAVWTSSTANAISSSITLLFSASLLFYYSWRLAFIMLSIFLLFFIMVWWVSRKVLPLIADVLEYKGKLDGLVFQLLNGIAKLRVAAKENTALALWSNLYNKVTVKNRQYVFLNNKLQIVANMLPFAGAIMIYSFIHFGLQQGGWQSGFNLGDFIAFNAAFGQVASTLTSLSMVYLSVLSTLPMARRMNPFLEQSVEVSAQKSQLPSLRGDVRFDSVEFHYQPDIPILKNVSLEIKAGEYVAIVGRSGSGKSTLFNLMLGFEQPQTGAVFVDDANIHDIDLSDLRQRIGVVLQDGALLPGSIYENIACEDTNVTLEAAWEAAEKAGLKRDIEELPMGMHTLLSAFGGGGLSGGQLQRTMIARALARNPGILLLDEATSALDNTTQRIVQDSLVQMNITRIVIAHRLTTISHADRIYVLDRGTVAEQGNYEELLEKRGLFYELAIRQMQVE